MSLLSHRLITYLTKTSGIPFFLITQSNTFFGTPSKGVSLGPKNTYTLYTYIYIPFRYKYIPFIYKYIPFILQCTVYTSCIPLKINTAPIVSFTDIKQNCISSKSLFCKAIFLTPFPSPSFHAQEASHLNNSCSS